MFVALNDLSSANVTLSNCSLTHTFKIESNHRRRTLNCAQIWIKSWL